MPFFRDDSRQPGDKLLPKLVASVVQAVIATKKGLTGHSHDLGTAIGQTLIDRMGAELAEHYRPFIEGALSEATDKMHPEMRKFLEVTARGDDQWKAFAGTLFGMSQSLLSDSISNAIAPLSYKIMGAEPNLVPAPDVIAQLWAAGLIDQDTALTGAHWQGQREDWYTSILDLARTMPGPEQIFDLINRGLLPEDQGDYWLHRNGLPQELRSLLLELRQPLLTVADASLAVLRGDLTEAQGREIAKQNGFTDDQFATLIANTGEPPGAEELMEALRRGFIDEATFKVGIRQSRVRDQWIDTLLKLRYSPMATADAVNAYVEGYVDEDTVKSIADQNGLEPGDYLTLIQAAGDPLSYTDMMRLWRYQKATEDDVRQALKRGRLKDDYIDFALALKDAPMSVADAIEATIQGYLTDDKLKEIAAMNGLRAEDVEPLRLTAGDPASRTEMIQLWRRGKVTEDQVKAALRESRLKDSYIDTVLELKTQLPALYEVRTLLADGSLTAAQGTELLLAQGYQDDIVKAIVKGAVNGTIANTKLLTEAMYADLYKEGAITADDFQSELKTLGYTQAGAELIQAVYDNQAAISARNSVIAKVKAAYTAKKITEQQAQDELNAIGLIAGMVEKLIDDWNLIVETNIKLLTEAQVVDAWFMQLFDSSNTSDNTQSALAYLETLGYSGPDAVTLLEIKNKGPLDATAQAKQVPGTATAGSTGTAS
jgi:hypothetical protein